MPDRAVVAISEDRQWLVVLDPEPEDWDEMHFNLFHFSRRWWTWEHELLINDTGQDAHEVLEKFLEGRDGTTPDSDYPLRDLPTDRAEADDVHPGAGAGTGQ